MLEPADVPDRSGEADLWLDYVADLGDGWNSTYTVARLLATEELKLDWDGETYSTERGQILVMGGDQVYPVPNANLLPQPLDWRMENPPELLRAQAPERLVQPGDRIILCMAKEVESGRKQVEIHPGRDVEYLEREIIQPSGAQLLLYLKSAAAFGTIHVLLAFMLGLHLGDRHVSASVSCVMLCGRARHPSFSSPLWPCP